MDKDTFDEAKRKKQEVDEFIKNSFKESVIGTINHIKFIRESIKALKDIPSFLEIFPSCAIIEINKIDMRVRDFSWALQDLQKFSFEGELDYEKILELGNFFKTIQAEITEFDKNIDLKFSHLPKQDWKEEVVSRFLLPYDFLEHLFKKAELYFKLLKVKREAKQKELEIKKKLDDFKKGMKLK